MHRILEPELMEEESQVKAYADANFEQPHNLFIEKVQQWLHTPFSGNVLDLGCGPGDISCRFARVYPGCRIDAVDGSKPMLDYGILSLTDELSQRIHFIHAKIPDADLPLAHYDVIISNSLLHHLPDAQVLWDTIKRYAKSGTLVTIMDLLRPETEELAKAMVQQYTKNEAPVLQDDFYHSLLAAFTRDEIERQLQIAGLNFSVQQISDRHVFIAGVIG